MDYDLETNNCTEDKMCGHYTQVNTVSVLCVWLVSQHVYADVTMCFSVVVQMVWADSKRIGCATHFCDTVQGLGLEKATLLVCDYYPS